MRTAKTFTSCHCRVVFTGPILLITLPRQLRRLRPLLHPRLSPRKYLRWHPSRRRRRRRYLLRPSPRPRPSYTSRSKNRLCRLLKLLMTTHSSCAIPLPRLSFHSLRPRLHKSHLSLVRQAQPYHHLPLHPSHTLLLRQRAGSSGAPHLPTFKRLSHNLHLHLDMPPHTRTPLCPHPQ